MLKLIIKNQHGMTFVEVIVAAMIFSLTSAGLFATITAINRPAGTSTREVKAVMLGKQILDGLRNEVDATTWDDILGKLAANGGDDGNGLFELGEIYNEDGIAYNATYQVDNDPDISARKVTLNITWTEMD